MSMQIFARRGLSIKRMNLEDAGYISSYVKNKLVNLNIDKTIIRRVVVATYEAEINVTIHSFGGECDFEIYNDHIYVVFKDTGPGIEDIEQAMVAGYSTASKDAISYGFGAGMGLLNIKNACDEFRISSSKEGTIVEIIIYWKEKKQTDEDEDLD